MKTVLGENLGGEEFQGNANVFCARQGRHEVKILDVQCHEVGIIRYNRLEQEFNCGEGSGVCFGRAVVVDAITTSGAANPVNLVHIVVVFLFRLWIIIGGVAPAVQWLLMKMDGHRIRY